MKDVLIKKLHEYIKEKNPDLLMKLGEDGKVTEYLLIKISSVDALINQNRGEKFSKNFMVHSYLRPGGFSYGYVICHLWTIWKTALITGA